MFLPSIHRAQYTGWWTHIAGVPQELLCMQGSCSISLLPAFLCSFTSNTKWKVTITLFLALYLSLLTCWEVVREIWVVSEIWGLAFVLPWVPMHDRARHYHIRFGAFAAQFSVSLERYKLCKSRCRTTLAQAYHSFLLVIILEKSSHSWMSSVSGLSTYRCTSAY